MLSWSSASEIGGEAGGSPPAGSLDILLGGTCVRTGITGNLQGISWKILQERVRLLVLDSYGKPRFGRPSSQLSRRLSRTGLNWPLVRFEEAFRLGISVEALLQRRKHDGTRRGGARRRYGRRLTAGGFVGRPFVRSLDHLKSSVRPDELSQEGGIGKPYG